ncbi:tetratricopeptide repeat protein [Planctomycetota bacterium]
MHILAKVYYRQERYDEAERLLQDALAGYQKRPFTQPSWLHPAMVLTGFYTRQGTYTQIKELLTSYLEDVSRVWGKNHPAMATPYNTVAWQLATSLSAEVRNGVKAVAYATKACELSQWQNYLWIDTLAAAYAEAGDFDAAVKWQKRAIEGLQDTHPGSTLKAQEYQERLKLYRADTPYREESSPYLF